MKTESSSNKLFLYFPFKAMSINHYTQIRAIRKGLAMPYVTKKGKIFKDSFNKVLLENSLQIIQFFEQLDPDRDQVDVKIVHLHTDFFTKKKTISTKCIDTDNVCKHSIDFVFKFAKRNDKVVRRVVAEKYYGDKDEFFIEIVPTQYHLS